MTKTLLYAKEKLQIMIFAIVSSIFSVAEMLLTFGLKPLYEHNNKTLSILFTMSTSNK